MIRCRRTFLSSHKHRPSLLARISGNQWCVVLPPPAVYEIKLDTDILVRLVLRLKAEGLLFICYRFDTALIQMLVDPMVLAATAQISTSILLERQRKLHGSHI